MVGGLWLLVLIVWLNNGLIDTPMAWSIAWLAIISESSHFLANRSIISLSMGRNIESWMRPASAAIAAALMLSEAAASALITAPVSHTTRGTDIVWVFSCGWHPTLLTRATANAPHVVAATFSSFSPPRRLSTEVLLAPSLARLFALLLTCLLAYLLD